MISLISLAAPVVINAAAETTGLNLTITPDKTTAALGDTITYTYSLYNSTSFNITNLTISDDKVSVSIPDTTLGASGNYTVTGTYIVKISDFPGPVINTATITGKLPNGDNITAQASASVQLTPYNSNLQIIKEADKTSASVNETITYKYTIVNSGDVELKDLVLTDNKLGVISLSATTLARSANITATKTYKVSAADYRDRWSIRQMLQHIIRLVR